jgi:hypothetical protein
MSDMMKMAGAEDWQRVPDQFIIRHCLMYRL